MKALVMLMLVIISSQVQAISTQEVSKSNSKEVSSSRNVLSTQIVLQADREIKPGSNELVTFGLPLAKGLLKDLRDIKVSIGNQEIGAYVAAGLRYHWLDNSIRSLIIQLHDVDMTKGDVTVTIDNQGSTLPRLAEVAHSEGWVKAGANKNSLPHPRIFALHDTAYLAQSGLIPPYMPAPDVPDAFEQFQVAQFGNNFGSLNYASSKGANWLFDRSSAMFKVYMTTGRVEFLKEAFLSKQFYFDYVKQTGDQPKAGGGDGCWTYGGVACSDGKYIAPQQAKLSLALLGDTSQWNNELIVNMALQADIGWNQYGSRDPFDTENEGFTERAAGLTGLAEVIAFEMTADQTILKHMNERIESLKDMQQSVKPWDIANGWVPKSGGFTHNIDVHEGNTKENSARPGNTNARGFSAWMSENIADFLWHAYWVTGHQDIPEMLRLLAHAVDNLGFTSTYNPASQDYDTRPEFLTITKPVRTKSCNTTGKNTSLLYITSAFADATTRTSDDWYPWYSDTHNIEVVLILAAGYYFEQNQEAKKRLASRITQLINGWSNDQCARVFSGVYRLFNWQHRSNSVRTWAWIAAQHGLENVLPASAVPPTTSMLVEIANSGTAVQTLATVGDLVDSKGTSKLISTGGGQALVFVATKTCAEGHDPHWQCGAKWTESRKLKLSDFIAICPGSEGGDYNACLKNDKFTLVSSVQSGDGLFFCPFEDALDGGRTACQGVKYLRSESIGK